LNRILLWLVAVTLAFAMQKTKQGLLLDAITPEHLFTETAYKLQFLNSYHHPKEPIPNTQIDWGFLQTQEKGFLLEPDFYFTPQKTGIVQFWIQFQDRRDTFELHVRSLQDWKYSEIPTLMVLGREQLIVELPESLDYLTDNLKLKENDLQVPGVHLRTSALSLEYLGGIPEIIEPVSLFFPLDSTLPRASDIRVFRRNSLGWGAVRSMRRHAKTISISEANPGEYILGLDTVIPQVMVKETQPYRKQTQPLELKFHIQDNMSSLLTKFVWQDSAGEYSKVSGAVVGFNEWIVSSPSIDARPVRYNVIVDDGTYQVAFFANWQTSGIVREGYEFTQKFRRRKRQVFSLPFSVRPLDLAKMLALNSGDSKLDILIWRQGEFVPMPLNSDLWFPPGHGFMVNFKSELQEEPVGTGVDFNVDREWDLVLSPGWNFVGNPFSIPLRVNDFIEGLKSKTGVAVSLWAEFNAISGVWQVSEELELLEPGKAYMLFSPQPLRARLYLSQLQKRTTPNLQKIMNFSHQGSSTRIVASGAGMRSNELIWQEVAPGQYEAHSMPVIPGQGLILAQTQVKSLGSYSHGMQWMESLNFSLQVKFMEPVELRFITNGKRLLLKDYNDQKVHEIYQGRYVFAPKLGGENMFSLMVIDEHIPAWVKQPKPTAPQSLQWNVLGQKSVFPFID
jgi:hypothetical protein